MIQWNKISEDVLDLLARENPSVTVFDLDKAIVAKIRAELNSLEFGKDAKATAKLTVNKDFSAQFSERQKALPTLESKPFMALLRFNDRCAAIRAEFPKFQVGQLPDTTEFVTLKKWVQSLRARTEVPAKSAEDAKREEAELAGTKA